MFEVVGRFRASKHATPMFLKASGFGKDAGEGGQTWHNLNMTSARAGLDMGVAAKVKVLLSGNLIDMEAPNMNQHL